MANVANGQWGWGHATGDVRGDNAQDARCPSCAAKMAALHAAVARELASEVSRCLRLRKPCHRALDCAAIDCGDGIRQSASIGKPLRNVAVEGSVTSKFVADA